MLSYLKIAKPHLLTTYNQVSTQSNVRTNTNNTNASCNKPKYKINNEDNGTTTHPTTLCIFIHNQYNKVKFIISFLIHNILIRFINRFMNKYLYSLLQILGLMSNRKNLYWSSLFLLILGWNCLLRMWS